MGIRRPDIVNNESPRKQNRQRNDAGQNTCTTIMLNPQVYPPRLNFLPRHDYPPRPNYPQTNHPPRFASPPRANYPPSFSSPPRPTRPIFNSPPRANCAPRFNSPPRGNFAPSHSSPPRPNFAPTHTSPPRPNYTQTPNYPPTVVSTYQYPPTVVTTYQHPPTVVSTYQHPSTYQYPPVVSTYRYPPQTRVITSMPPHYPPYSVAGYNNYTYPQANWNSMVPQVRPIYSPPTQHMPPRASMPVNIHPPILTAPAGLYGPMILSSPMVTEPTMSIVPYAPPQQVNIPICCPDFQYMNGHMYRRGSAANVPPVTDSHNRNFVTGVSNSSRDSVAATLTPRNFNARPFDTGSYLRLPRELFPSIRMMTYNPNPLIDELCRVTDIDIHAEWIMDLEFGIPRTPVINNRRIAMFNVQLNCVSCWNTPGDIHPDFEVCSPDLKRVFLVYYDGIMAAWYRGFTIINSDPSLANFQSWLRPPMQIFGMAWP